MRSYEVASRTSPTNCSAITKPAIAAPPHARWPSDATLLSTDSGKFWPIVTIDIGREPAEFARMLTNRRRSDGVVSTGNAHPQSNEIDVQLEFVSILASVGAMHRLDERALWLARNVLPHEAALRAWLQRRAVTGIDIDDIVQETYAKLSTVVSVAEIRDVRRYVFQTAHSVVVSYVRRSRIVPIQTMANLEAIETWSDEPDPETSVMDKDELNRLALAIADLPGKVRDVFVLRRVDGLSQRQVAERLGLAESTVEKHMSKGFRHLSTLFGRGGKARAQASRVEQQETPPLHEPTKQPGD